MSATAPYKATAALAVPMAMIYTHPRQKAEPPQKGLLRSLRLDHTSQPELLTVIGWQDHVDALDPAHLL